MSSRPTRITNPTSRLLDPNNIGSPALSFHRQAVADAAAAKVGAAAQLLKENPVILPHTSSSLSLTEPTPSSRQPSPNEILSEDDEGNPGPSDDGSGTDSDSPTTMKKPAKKRRKQARKMTDVSSVVDEDGMINDINIISIDDDNNTIKKKINPTADVKYFFKLLPHEANNKKKCSACKTSQVLDVPRRMQSSWLTLPHNDGTWNIYMLVFIENG
ncbi:hypothetical protein BYT27DRAFT_6394866 [Phlegmacium glaucopus]|nr:hypothetical protein BYT27DRAFT_6394866 [Phlegmacium glaucopus]